ncbi:hypothetical protein VTG60DRAFT_6036 [Thermothelomyces hinnuleus]
MFLKFLTVPVTLMSLMSTATALSIPAQLQLADTAVDRYQILPNDEDFVFDFNKATFPMANRKTFPALVGTNLALAIAEIEGTHRTTGGMKSHQDRRMRMLTKNYGT